MYCFFFFSSRRRHTRFKCDWSSDVCSSDLKLGRSHRIAGTVVVGGSDMQAQIRGLRQRPDIIVATPGRLLDHMWNGTINLAPIKILVLDEADRMLDMGFPPQTNQ